MATTWQAIVGATTYNLDDGSPFHREAATGLGIATVRRLFQQGPLQHGHTDRGYRMDPRYIFLTLYFNAATRAAADTNRDTLAEIFKPLTSIPIKLKVTRDDGAIRQINCFTEGVIDLPAQYPDRISQYQRVLVPLKAASPLWYDPSFVNLQFESVIGGTEGFQIPMEIPWDQASGSVIDATETITYTGNFREFPTIRITGPATDATITNVTTGETLDFTGTTISGGDYYDIDLAAHTVKDSSGTNKIADLTSDSDLGTWHLATHPEATDGENDIQVEITSDATTATRVSITYYNRYVHL